MSANEVKSNQEREPELRRSPMMAHLLDSLSAGIDIGHYGRLTFVMVARHFLPPERIVELLSNQPGLDELEARSMLMQVQEGGYNPPKREKILEWQSHQDFPICPVDGDPRACNPYGELKFPPDVYEEIEHFWREKAAA